LRRRVIFSSLLFSGRRRCRRVSVYGCVSLLSPVLLPAGLQSPFLRGFSVVSFEVRQRDVFRFVVKAEPSDTFDRGGKSLHAYKRVYIGRQHTVYNTVYGILVEPTPQTDEFSEDSIALNAKDSGQLHQLRLI